MVEIQKSAETGISFSEIFSYNPKKDLITRTDIPMTKESELGERSGMTFQEMKQEKEEKKMILEFLLKNKINSFSKVQEVIQRYYVDPESVLSRK